MSVLVTPPLASAATLHRLRPHAAFFPDVHIFTLLTCLCQLNRERSREERDMTYKLDEKKHVMPDIGPGKRMI